MTGGTVPAATGGAGGMQGRILVIEGSVAGRILARARLQDAFLTAALAADLAKGLRAAQDNPPDLVLVGLPLAGHSAESALAALRALPGGTGLPVVAMTDPADAALRMAALTAGFDDAMPRAGPDSLFAARIRSLLRHRAALRMVAAAWGSAAPDVLGMAEARPDFRPPATIGFVTERPETGLRWKHQLFPGVGDRVAVLTRDQVLASTATAASTDLLVIEADLDQPDGGLWLMRQLSGLGRMAGSGFCIVTATADPERAANALDLGADEVIAAPDLATELLPRLRGVMRRKRQADRLRRTMEEGLRSAMIDPLTGVYNRRYAMPRLAGIAAQARAEQSDFAILLLDLDHFKAVNDHHGHAAGDQVLTELARRLADNLRGPDLLARFGGEEFIAVLPRTRLEEARQSAERLRDAVQAQPVRLAGGGVVRATISVGVAMGRLDEESAGDLTGMIDAADRALMQAKSAGRNLVTCQGREAAA